MFGANVRGRAAESDCCASSPWRVARASRTSRRSAVARGNVWIRIFQPYLRASRSTNKKLAAPRIEKRPAGVRNRVRLPANAGERLVAGAAGSLLHAFGDDAHLVDTGTFCRVDDIDDVLIPKLAGSHEKHLLVFPLLVDVLELLFELWQRDILFVHGDAMVRRVGQHDLADVWRDVRGLLGFCRQVDVDALLRQVDD